MCDARQHQRCSLSSVANAGWVERLCLLTRPNGEFVALTGENNAFDRSFAAVIRANDPPSCSPAGGASRCRFEYAARTPQDYVLFPTTEMLAAADVPYGSAHSFDQINDVASSCGCRPAEHPGYLLTILRRDRTRSVMPSDNCPRAHRRLGRKGIASHLGQVPELQKPLTIVIGAEEADGRIKKCPGEPQRTRIAGGVASGSCPALQSALPAAMQFA